MDKDTRRRILNLLYEASSLANNAAAPPDGREPEPIDEVMSHIEEAIDWLGSIEV